MQGLAKEPVKGDVAIHDLVGFGVFRVGSLCRKVFLKLLQQFYFRSIESGGTKLIKALKSSAGLTVLGTSLEHSNPEFCSKDWP